MSSEPTQSAEDRQIVWEDHQLAFLRATEPYVGLFGGVGNGKTLAGCAAIVSHSVHNPGNLCLVGRLTYPELRDSTREVFLDLVAKKWPSNAYKVNFAENSLTFWNKSQVIFRHLDDQGSLLGPNLGAFYIDQAEQVDEEAFKTLQSRLRRPNVQYRQGLVTGNPHGHDWVYYAFGMDKAGRSRDWCHNTDYRMLTAPTIANRTNLPVDYIDQLKRSYSPEWFERYVMGSWDAWTGQIWDITKIQGYDQLPKIICILSACDPAISKESTACDTAFSTVGVGDDGLVYDLETTKAKLSFNETLEHADGLLRRQRTRYLGVENTGYQMALVETCRRYFPDIEVCSLKADRDKFRRAKSVSHIIDRGLFRTNNRELLDQMSSFDPAAPASSKKDMVDALVHALHMVQMYAPIAVPDVSVHDAYHVVDKETGKRRPMTSTEAFFKSTMEQLKRDDAKRNGETEDVQEFAPYSGTDDDKDFY